MDILKEIGREAMEKKEVPEFRAGDTVRVFVRIVEKGLGKKEKARVRPQMFEGVVLRRRSAGVSSTFTVRKISYGVGVERIFPIYSPPHRGHRGGSTRRGAAGEALLPPPAPRQGRPPQGGSAGQTVTAIQCQSCSLSEKVPQEK